MPVGIIEGVLRDLGFPIVEDSGFSRLSMRPLGSRGHVGCERDEQKLVDKLQKEQAEKAVKPVQQK